MGHYDSCREGYCAGCGAAPGNMVNGVCPFCTSYRSAKNPAKEDVLKEFDKQNKIAKKLAKIEKLRKEIKELEKI
jgi:hypothetical protein